MKSQTPTGFQEGATPEEIIEVVEEAMGIENMRQRNPTAVMHNRPATAGISLARGIAMTIIRFETGLSTTQIGDIFDVGHDMVIWWSKKIQARMLASPSFNATIERLILKSRLAATGIGCEGAIELAAPLQPSPPVPLLRPAVAISDSVQPITMEERFEQWRAERRANPIIRPIPGP